MLEWNKYHDIALFMCEVEMKDGKHIDKDGTIRYYVNNQLHREDGPAMEWVDGYKSWFLNGKLHREDGPAIEYADGSKEWWLNGQRHREDGPAVKFADGRKWWYLNNIQYTEKEFKEYKLIEKLSGLK